MTEKNPGRYAIRADDLAGWQARRISDLEAENAELRQAVAGSLSPEGQQRVRAIRAEYIVLTGRTRGRRKAGVRLRWEVMERDNHRCVYCGATAADGKLVLDHVIPQIDGGTETLDNLVTACELCNAGKADRPLLSSQIR